MAYNTSLANAIQRAPHLTIDASSVPTTTQATAIWTGAYDSLNARLATAGITVDVAPDTSQAYALLQRIEGMLTVGELIQVVHGIGGHATSDLAAKWLAQAEEEIQRIEARPGILADLGATSSIETATIARAYWTANAQADLDPQAVVEPEFHVEDSV